MSVRQATTRDTGTRNDLPTVRPGSALGQSVVLGRIVQLDDEGRIQVETNLGPEPVESLLAIPLDRELILALIADPAMSRAASTNGIAEELLADIELDLGHREAARAAFVRAAGLYGIQEQYRRANQCWQRAADLENALSTMWTLSQTLLDSSVK